MVRLDDRRWRRALALVVAVAGGAGCGHAGPAARRCGDPAEAAQAVADAEAANLAAYRRAVTAAGLELLDVAPVEVGVAPGTVADGEAFEHDERRWVAAAPVATPGGRQLARTADGTLVLVHLRPREVSKAGYELCGCPPWTGGGAEVAPPTTVPAYPLPDEADYAGLREVEAAWRGDYIYYDNRMADGTMCQPPP